MIYFHCLAAIGDGEGVLIILDGFDELPREQREKGSVYIDLIKREELLPEATVLITSRPSVSAYLIGDWRQATGDRRLEILGFTEARIEDYARSVYSDPKALDDFLKYINGNPFIKGMMYLPLNAVFVASIFEYHHTTDLPFPKTMTQLYDVVTSSLIRRHLVDKNLDCTPIRTLQSMKDIKRLPNPVPDQLLELARIAFEGLLYEKYVFIDPGNELFDHLGMMKKTLSLDDPTGPTYMFTFLHLTLQEYLSTLHMSLVLSPTQLYDALICRLIRRHIMVKKLVPADYLMPRTLQSREDINRLPRAIADQLLVIAKIAYEGIRDEKYKFTDLDIEFVHFGMMKKNIIIKVINHTDGVPTFTIAGLVFHHFTLQEHLSALYISLMGLSLTNDRNIRPLYWHSDLGLLLLPDIKDIVFRFLAGLCKHSSSFSCQQVGNLAFTFTPSSLQVARCVYESDSIVQENQNIQEMFSSNEILGIWENALPFDYYIIGHCICHHGGMWDIPSYGKEEIDLLVQGLKSCDSPRGKLQELIISDVGLLELDPLLVRDLQKVEFEQVTFTASSVNMIRKYISPADATFKIFNILNCEHVEQLFPIVFDESSLDTLDIVNDENTHHISDDAMKLLMNNSNLKDLYLDFSLKLPAHTVCDNTSLDYLANLLVMFIESYHTPLKIKTSNESSEFDVDLYFKTDSGKPKTEFKIFIYKSCDYNITEQILERIPEQYHNSIVS